MESDLDAFQKRLGSFREAKTIAGDKHCNLLVREVGCPWAFQSAFQGGGGWRGESTEPFARPAFACGPPAARLSCSLQAELQLPAEAGVRGGDGRWPAFRGHGPLPLPPGLRAGGPRGGHLRQRLQATLEPPGAPLCRWAALGAAALGTGLRLAVV